MTLRVVKDGLTLEILQGDLERSAPVNIAGGYAVVDTVPLANGLSHDDDDLGEGELEAKHDIELSAFSSRKK